MAEQAKKSQSGLGMSQKIEASAKQFLSGQRTPWKQKGERKQKAKTKKYIGLFNVNLLVK